MITEEQLKEAIAECNGRRNPDANTCLKLASYYTIKNELFPKGNETMIRDSYSFAAPQDTAQNTIYFDSGTEFARAINGKPINEVLRKLDEIVSAVYIVDNSLYRRIMRDLTE